MIYVKYLYYQINIVFILRVKNYMEAVGQLEDVALELFLHTVKKLRYVKQKISLIIKYFLIGLIKMSKKDFISINNIMKRGIDDDPPPESMFLKKSTEQIPEKSTQKHKKPPQREIRKPPPIDTNAYIIIRAHGCIESRKILRVPPGISRLHKKNISAYGFCSWISGYCTLDGEGENNIGVIMDNLIKESKIIEESFPTYHDVHKDMLTHVTAEQLSDFKENPDVVPESIKKKIQTSFTVGPITEEFCRENTCKVITSEEFTNRKYSPICRSADGIVPLIIYLSFNHKRYNLFNHMDIQKLAKDTIKVRESVNAAMLRDADSFFAPIFQKVHTLQKIELSDIFLILHAICATSCNIIDFSCAAECSNTEEHYESGSLQLPQALAPSRGYGKRTKTRRGKNNKYKRNTRRRK
jgi:hypothetical protein